MVVADTLISDVDGERGRLIIAGADVEQLALVPEFASEPRGEQVPLGFASEPRAEQASWGPGGYEAVVHRVLLAGEGTAVQPPSTAAHEVATGRERDIARALGQARAAAWALVPGLGDALGHPDGMDALRTALGHLRATGDHRTDAIAAIGAAPVFVAAWSRRRAGEAPIAPDPALSHATDYLQMTTGGPADPARVRALDTYLVTVIDHAMSASTFTARVIASTHSDLISAVVGAVGALKGPLHGGAPGPVLDMLDAIGTPDHAETWLLGELAAGRRIMGMGHRVYRVRDPRAAVLEAAVRPLASPRLALARAVETAAAKILRERKPDRPLAANVEFYTAVLLDAVGLPREQFAPTFAVSRLAGWSAHVIEERRTGRLIRPASRYLGAMPRQP
ncbi:MAG TPA: citrate synthase [Kofleriaceae bacterium]|nr:citrate synthase [Kofleriaceae bacterium]